MKFKRTSIFTIARLILNKYLESREEFRTLKIQLLWRDSNRHNYTKIVSDSKKCDFPIAKVKVGNFTYGPLNVKSYGSSDEFLEIGNYCSIAEGVKFILGGEHRYNTLTTYPFRRIVIDNSYVETFSKGPIIVEDDVWIGANSLILSGVKLSKGTVVAAGSVVTKSTEPYSIVGGNPAKLIRKRFSDDYIKKLMNLDLSHVLLTQNSEWCLDAVDENLLNHIDNL